MECDLPRMLLDTHLLTEAFGQGFIWGASALGTAILLRSLYRLFD